jgi:Domain of unknown function (DUF4397)
MKKYSLIIKNITIAVALTAGLFACVGESNNQLTIVTPAAGGRVKFIHAVPDGPGISILVNSRQFSGVLTSPPAVPALISYAGLYPANDYALIDAGPAKVEVVIPAAGTTPQTTIISGTVPVEANKYYSVFALGSAALGGLEPLVVEDKLTPADTSKAYIRFVNTVANTTTGYDMGIGTNFPTALANIKYKQVTDFVAIDPAPVGASASPVVVRLNGTTVNLAPTTLTLTPLKRRFYTIYIRGRVGGTGTSAISASGYTNK